MSKNEDWSWPVYPMAAVKDAELYYRVLRRAGLSRDLAVAQVRRIYPGGSGRWTVDPIGPLEARRSTPEQVRTLREAINQGSSLSEVACTVCSVRRDYDDEWITTHCAAHCPRVAAGDWESCRGC
jgi:hypothetical protein